MPKCKETSERLTLASTSQKLCLKIGRKNAHVNCIKSDFDSGGVSYIYPDTCCRRVALNKWCSVLSAPFHFSYPAPPLQHFADPQGLNQTHLSRNQWLRLKRTKQSGYVWQFCAVKTGHHDFCPYDHISLFIHRQMHVSTRCARVTNLYAKPFVV